MATNDSKKLNYVIQPASLNQQLINDCVAQLQPPADSQETRIVFDVDETASVIYGDAGHLSIATININENAIKYADEPRVHITTGRKSGMITLTIKDNAIGIDQKYLKRIFQKFYRVPTGNIHNVKGLGLGLNFSKQIIQEYNGKTQMSSLPGISTEFNIFFQEMNHHEKNQNSSGRR